LQSPFGDAKPRETVIAQRTGKNEEAILKEEAEEYSVKIRLTSEQFAEKKERLDQIDELKAAIATGDAEDVAAAEVRHSVDIAHRLTAVSIGAFRQRIVKCCAVKASVLDKRMSRLLAVIAVIAHCARVLAVPMLLPPSALDAR
jgi:predicted membrane chloride channel (bestrophin family)